jgi:hypothetical protein
VYPHLNKPDTKFNTEGVYRVKLNLPADEAAELVEKIDAAMEHAYEEAVNAAETPGKAKRVKRADAPYQEDEDGSINFNFKLTASGISKKDGTPWEMKPAIFDARGQVIPHNTVRIGGGSLIRVSFEMNEFYTALVGAGVSLRLRGVQVIELVEWGGNAESHGFGDEEEGFSYVQTEPVGNTAERENSDPEFERALDGETDGDGPDSDF